MSESSISQSLNADSLANPVPEAEASLESVLCTEELRRRPSRMPDYEKENRALVALAHALTDTPRTVLQTLADTIVEVCESDSAGISLLTTDDGGKRFYWPAIAGKWKPHIGGGTPRDFSPCGDVLDRNIPLLMRHVEWRYTYFQPVAPPVEEVLLVPFYVKGKAVGTIWAVAHDERRKFDAEDERIMGSLGNFASSAYQLLESLDALKLQATKREKVEVALRQSEANLRDFVETATIGMHWVGPDGNVLWANQTELDLLGYPREEYIGRHIAEFHTDLLVVDNILARLNRGEILREYPARLRCKNGSIRHVLISSSALFEDGKFVHTRCFTRDITEQVRAEEQWQATERTLRENELRFREMIDALPVAIYTTDAQGRLTHFNPAAAEFSGHGPELGTDQWCVSWKLFWPDGTPMPHDECPMAVALREGRIVRNVEAIAERPDGTRIAFVPYPTPLRDTDGRIVGGINMLLDITERKQVERATALLAAIVDSSDDAIISKGLDGVITSWNNGAERIFGYRADEAVGQSITLIIPQDRRDEEANILKRLHRGERIDHFDTVRVANDGKLVDISLSISPVKDAQGRVMGASEVARDVTERKQAERTLAESEERFRTLFASAPMAVFVCDRNAVIQHYNRRAVELWGREPVCGVEQHCGSLKLWLPNGTVLPHAHTPMVEVLRTGIPALNVEVFIERPDGSRLPVLVNFAPLKNAQGETTGTITSFVDITERKEAETALRESEERFRTLADQLDAQVRVRTVQLDRRNSEVLKQSEQLRELSHRLIQAQDNERRHIARELHDSAGQILAALSMNLATVASQARKDAPKLAGAAEEGEQLVQQLSQEIRTMSYLLHPPLLDESGLSQALRWYTQGLTERSGLDISLNIPEDFGRLSPEMELVMFRLVQECLTNVHRHSGSNKALIRIARESESVALEVEDEGQGISTEKLVEIQSQGSGVGIAGMRERVRSFQGEMSIQSNGSGTKIRFTFPMAKTATSSLQTIVQPVQAAS